MGYRDQQRGMPKHVLYRLNGAGVLHYFFVQKMASLVEAIHFKLSGMLSSWLRENIKCNIFLQPCNFEKIVRIMPQVTAMLPHHCKLTLIPHTIQRDQMPLSKIFSASASNAIFWTTKVIKHTFHFPMPFVSYPFHPSRRATFNTFSPRPAAESMTL